mgnify:CR=1 FL=1
MPDKNPRSELSRLLLSLFSAEELRRLIRYLPDGDTLSAELPGATASAAHLVDSVGAMLERHGLLSDDLFFARVREERPRRVGEIDAVAGLFRGASPARAVRSPASPEPPARPSSPGRDNDNGEGVVRILHLSDFHFGAATAWDSATCLGRLAADIRGLREEVGPPDLVVLSGDIANTGKVEEYAQARAWIEQALMPAAQVEASQIIPAPGNHDVDRGRTQSAVARAAQAELLRSGKQEDVAALLAGEDADVLLRRHAAFVQFADAMRLGGVAWQHPWASVRRSIRGLEVHVAAFSSAWLAASDQDHGNLLLGLYQANLLLRDAESADLVVSVMHHPWAFFATWDRPAQIEVQRISSLVLRGHLHDAGQQLVQGNAHGVVQELAAGAAYESSLLPNSYHLLEARPRAGTLRIRPRFWDVRRREWRADRNLFDAEVHEVPIRRAPAKKA